MQRVEGDAHRPRHFGVGRPRFVGLAHLRRGEIGIAGLLAQMQAGFFDQSRQVGQRSALRDIRHHLAAARVLQREIEAQLALAGQAGHEIAAAEHIIGAEPLVQCRQTLRRISAGRRRGEIAARRAHEFIGQRVHARAVREFGREHVGKCGRDPVRVLVGRQIMEIDDRERRILRPVRHECALEPARNRQCGQRQCDGEHRGGTGAVAAHKHYRAIRQLFTARGDRLAGEMVLHVGGERGDVRIAALGLAAQRRQYDDIEIAAQLPRRHRRRFRLAAARRRRILVFDHAEHVALAQGAFEIVGVRAGQQFVEDAAERVHVRRRRDFAAAQLLRRRVDRRHRLLALQVRDRVRVGHVAEQLGDAEIKQLHPGVARHQHVRRFQIAVHDLVLVRELHRRADVEKDAQAAFEPDFVLAAVLEQRQTLDVFHREIRIAVGGDAAVDEMSDVRVVQTRENLPLAQEAAMHRFRIEPGADELERDALLELAVVALGEPDYAHAAGAEFAQQPPRPDAVTRVHRQAAVAGISRRGGAARLVEPGLEARRGVVRRDQSDDVAAQFLIARAEPVEKFLARFARRIEDFLEHRENTLPALRLRFRAHTPPFRPSRHTRRTAPP